MSNTFTDDISVSDATLLKRGSAIGFTVQVVEAMNAALAANPDMYKSFGGGDSATPPVGESVIPKGKGYLIDKSIYPLGVPMDEAGIVISTHPYRHDPPGPNAVIQFAQWQWSVPAKNPDPAMPLPTSVLIAGFGDYSDILPGDLGTVLIPRGLLFIVTQTLEFNATSGDPPSTPDVTGDRSWIHPSSSYAVVAAFDVYGEKDVTDSLGVATNSVGKFIRINALVKTDS